MSAEVTRMGLLDAQVCVPAEWTDEQARAFLEQQYSCGTSHGWQMRHNGHEALGGCSELRSMRTALGPRSHHVRSLRKPK